MDRSCKVIGFLGMDKYEYIIYLARVLLQLGKKVLLVDLSESGALSACIPCPQGLTGKTIEYRGVMFHDGRPAFDTSDLLKSEADCYDCIIIDYGFRRIVSSAASCDILVFVTDQQLHHIRNLSLAVADYGSQQFLVIKNYSNNKINPDFILHESKLDKTEVSHTYIICQDEVDDRCRINCQYNDSDRFQKLSSQTKGFIKGLLFDAFSELAKHEINKAYKRAEKGM